MVTAKYMIKRKTDLHHQTIETAVNRQNNKSDESLAICIKQNVIITKSDALTDNLYPV